MKKTAISEEDMIENDIYSEESRDELIENDEIDSSEAGFMKGYEEAV